MNTPTRSRLKAQLSMAMDNPAWVVMDAISRFPVARNVVRACQRFPGIGNFDLSRSILAPVDIDAAVKQLHSDGFFTGLRLPEDVVREIREYAFADYCYGDADVEAGFRYADRQRAEARSGKSFSKAVYFFPDAVRNTLERIEDDPLLNAIASAYIHAAPVKTGYRLWWTFATPADRYDSSITTSFFHYDKDDYAAIRFFFHLSDVGEGNGPHVVARGSHQRKRINQLVSFGERDDRDIAAQYGEDNLVTIKGPAGTGFGEDPYCFHKATRPTAGDRLMLEVKFAARDYRIFPPANREKSKRIID